MGVPPDSARAAFDIAKETDKLRDAYGRNAAGQRMLLARRLVEAGVRFVSLTYGGWDHHDNIRNGVSNQMPNLDQAFAALIRDLSQRGMLDSTLVLLTTVKTRPGVSLPWIVPSKSRVAPVLIVTPLATTRPVLALLLFAL